MQPAHNRLRFLDDTKISDFDMSAKDLVERVLTAAKTARNSHLLFEDTSKQEPLSITCKADWLIMGEILLPAQGCDRCRSGGLWAASLARCDVACILCDVTCILCAIRGGTYPNWLKCMSSR